jgi:hypothetical protein
MLSWRPTNGDRYDSKVKQYPNLFVVLIQKRECRLVVADELCTEGYKHIASKFDVPEGYGAMSVLSGRSTPGRELSAFEADAAAFDAVIRALYRIGGRLDYEGTMFACRKK